MSSENLSQILQQLRDIHLPHPVGFWPLAPGWYVLLALGVGLFAVLGLWAVKRWLAARPKKHALKELAALRTQLREPGKEQLVLVELSSLIRRYALVMFGHDAVASLHGQCWLAFLDKTGQTTAFTQGEGQVLASAPYQRQKLKTPEPLFNCVKNWIEKAR